MNKVKSPLFRDPVYDGAADPTVIFNHLDNKWYMFYTNRRATEKTNGVEWVHGTDIGIAVYDKAAGIWSYQGILKNLEIEEGRNTFWAPEIIYEQGLFHMYLSYVQGVPSDWKHERHILHYTSENLFDWKYIAPLTLSSNKCIDACVHKLPNGNYGLWYKDELHGSHTFRVESPDLFTFSNPQEAIFDTNHEGPNVFFFEGCYWMITDFWRGIGVYRSTDCESFVRCPNILDTDGSKPDDNGYGHHADVVVNDGHAYIFYFTHPGRESAEQSEQHAAQRTSIQVRELKVTKDGLVCNRDDEPELNL